MKQIGDIKITGTFGDLTCYQLNGQFYGRSKSTLTGKRFRNDKAFARSRQSSSRFARGNKLASKVYGSLPKEQKAYSLFCQLKSKAILLFKQGKEEAEVLQSLNYHIAELSNSLIASSPNLQISKSPHSPISKFPNRHISKSHHLYFTGCEHLPLRLSKRDIWGLEEGLEQDMLNIVKKMEKRLAKKQKRIKKLEAKPVVIENKQTVTAPKLSTRKIIKPTVLRPRWNKTTYRSPAPVKMCYPDKKYKRPRAPA